MTTAIPPAPPSPCPGARETPSDDGPYYAVRKGKDGIGSCIFLLWSDCLRYVSDVDDAEFDRFVTIGDAVRYLRSNWQRGDDGNDGEDENSDGSVREEFQGDEKRAHRSRVRGGSRDPNATLLGMEEVTTILASSTEWAGRTPPLAAAKLPQGRPGTKRIQKSDEDGGGEGISTSVLTSPVAKRSCGIQRKVKQKGEEGSGVADAAKVGGGDADATKYPRGRPRKNKSEDEDGGRDEEEAGTVAPGSKRPRGRPKKKRPGESDGDNDADDAKAATTAMNLPRVRRRKKGPDENDGVGDEEDDRAAAAAAAAAAASSWWVRGSPKPAEETKVSGSNADEGYSSPPSVPIPREEEDERQSFPLRTREKKAQKKRGSRSPSSSWMYMYECLRGHMEQTGRSDVSPAEDLRLSTWVTELRWHYRKGMEAQRQKSEAGATAVSEGELRGNGGRRKYRISDEKIVLLNKLGFDFRYSSPEEKAENQQRDWKEGMSRLCQFHAKEGNFDVPSKGHELSDWVNFVFDQAKLLRTGKEAAVTAEQLEEFRALTGYASRAERDAARRVARDADKFDLMISELKAFKSQHGHIRVKTNPFTQLSYWVMCQRREYRMLREGRPSRLTAERMSRLAEVGFEFEAVRDKKLTFEERLEQLRQYKEKNGHLRVPTNHETLGTFVSNMRARYWRKIEGSGGPGRHPLSEKQARALDEMGFVWRLGKKMSMEQRLKKKKTFDERFQDLLVFKEEFGHTVVPQHYPDLGTYVHSLRQEYKKFKRGTCSVLNHERVTRLIDIGFVFDAKYRRGSKLGEDLRKIGGKKQGSTSVA